MSPKCLVIFYQELRLCQSGHLNHIKPLSKYVLSLVSLMMHLFSHHAKVFWFLYRNGFKIAAGVIAMVATLLGFIYPAANAVALMMLGAPCVSILWKEIQRYVLMVVNE